MEDDALQIMVLQIGPQTLEIPRHIIEDNVPVTEEGLPLQFLWVAVKVGPTELLTTLTGLKSGRFYGAGSNGLLALPMAPQPRPMAGCHGIRPLQQFPKKPPTGYSITFGRERPSGTEDIAYIAVHIDFWGPGQTFPANAG